MWFAASRWQPEPKEPAEAGQSLPDVPTVAVLPFVNLSGDPKQDYFSDGITEDILTELSRARDLRVLARNTTFQYKGKAVDVGKLGRELGVLMCSKAPSAVVTTAIREQRTKLEDRGRRLRVRSHSRPFSRPHATRGKF